MDTINQRKAKMNTLILKIAIISMLTITALGCQSTKLVNKAGIEITNEQKFTLNIEATFRPFTELPSIKPPDFSKEVLELYYEYYPDWSTLKKAEGGTALTRTHGKFSREWKRIYEDAMRAYVNNNTRLAMYAIDTLYQAANMRASSNSFR